MGKIINLIAFGLVFAGISFVVRNMVLGQEFDVVTEVINLVTVLAVIFAAHWILGKAPGVSTAGTPKVSLK